MNAEKYEIPLFRKCPSLKKMARLPLLDGPTKIHRLEKLENYLSGNRSNYLWIKRDDQVGSLGGNKVRKLEFIMGDLLKKGKTSQITIGRNGSNQALVTALVGEKKGIKTELILGPQPVTEDVQQKLLTFHALGAKMHFNRTLPGMGFDMLKCILKSKFTSTGPYYIPPGGSSNIGMLGYVNAFLEFWEQVKNEKMPIEIVLPVGTGGTVAGLLVGSALANAGDRVKIIGVDVINSSFPNENYVRKKAYKLYQFILKNLSDKERIALSSCNFKSDESVFQYITSYASPGYGYVGEEVFATVKQLYDLEGIKLESTYSGKAMHFLLDHLKEKLTKKTAVPTTVFWLTYNSYDLSAIINKYPWQNPQQKWRDLPPEFWSIFKL